MATLAEARAAIVTVLGAGSVKVSDDPGAVDPPVVYIFGNGTSDLRGLGRTSVPYGFRLMCIVALQDAPAASAALTALCIAAFTVLKGAGYRVDSLGPESVADIAGGKYLAADILISTMVSF